MTNKQTKQNESVTKCSQLKTQKAMQLRPVPAPCCPEKVLHIICTGCGHDYGSHYETLEQVERDTAESICKTIDRLESTDENTSMEQWKNYKRIRNTIRDEYYPINSLKGNK